MNITIQSFHRGDSNLDTDSNKSMWVPLRVQITKSNYNASTQATRSGLSLSAKTASISRGGPETYSRVR